MLGHLTFLFRNIFLFRRATIAGLDNRGKNVTLIMAMSEEGIVHHAIELGSVNTRNFINFLTDLLLLEQTPVVVMDNVPFHHGKEVSNAIHEHGHEIMHTPPYSPFLNPIEDLFHLIKGTMT